MKYLWRSLAIFIAAFGMYVLIWTYNLDTPDPLFAIFSIAYLTFWVPISLTLIYYSFKK